ncbi:DUF397 domain-containing protein [Nocardiopsis trehalosi]|uniref:DUF397 domain-containing protein n=1 Tax=Nocardiopsis trehalosi TaxID=109329 RepID=UPI0008307E03|nr:DUF397 domain-containing protein [Nocardiopsis trehalosi]
MTGEWKKSSYSGGNGGDCVECRTPDGVRVEVRDSVHPGLARLAFPKAEWHALIADADRM